MLSPDEVEQCLSTSSRSDGSLMNGVDDKEKECGQVVCARVFEESVRVTRDVTRRRLSIRKGKARPLIRRT